MAEPLEPHQGFVSRAEHDALRVAHTVFAHRMAIVALAVVAGIGFVAYKGYRDFEQARAAWAAEKAARTAAAPGAPQQPVVVRVETAPVVQPSGFLGRGGGSGKTFTPRQVQPANTKPAEVQHTDTKSGAVTIVRCPTGEPTQASSTDARGAVTTVYACPPAPPPPPNVTRFDPPTDKDRKAIEERYPQTPLGKFDLLGEIDAPRTRTHRRYGLFVPKAGGDLDAEKWEEPRSTWAWGRHLELYGEVFRQQTFGIGSGGIAAQPAGYGAAAGALLDAFRFKDLHFQPMAEGGWVAGSAYVRVGARVPLCVGAECP